MRKKLVDIAELLPYTLKEIIDFKALTGKSNDEVYETLTYYANYGLPSIEVVNHVIRLGHYNG